MKQEINLYQPIFRREKKIFSAVAMAQVAAIVAAGLAAIYGYGAHTVLQLEEQVEHLERRIAGAQTRLDVLTRTYPPRSRSAVLEAELNRLQRELGQAENVARALSKGTFGNTSGLSGYLAGLARQHIEGAWLTKVRVARGGDAVGFGGRALAPELVPVYLGRLSAEPAFSGKTFSALELVVDEEQPGIVRFEVQTEGAGLGAVPAAQGGKGG